jgi:hypothetical protein
MLAKTKLNKKKFVSIRPSLLLSFIGSGSGVVFTIYFLCNSWNGPNKLVDLNPERLSRIV